MSDTSSSQDNQHLSDRRKLIQTTVITSAAIGGSASVLANGSDQSTASTPEASPEATPTGNSVLLVFFSRPGDNYYYGDRIDLEVGNTKVLAGMISDRITCDVYEIEAADPYPASYDQTRDRNVQEQIEDARPAIANPLPSIVRYDTIIVGSPLWNVRPPMIMDTFAESFDFSGKRVLPVVTYAVSGMGSTVRVYHETFSGATLSEGLAVQGEEMSEAVPAVEEWLKRVGLVSN